MRFLFHDADDEPTQEEQVNKSGNISLISFFFYKHAGKSTIHVETGSCAADFGPSRSEWFVSPVPERLGGSVDDFNVPDKVVQSTAPNPCAADEPYWYYIRVVDARTPLSDAEVNP